MSVLNISVSQFNSVNELIKIYQVVKIRDPISVTACSLLRLQVVVLGMPSKKKEKNFRQLSKRWEGLTLKSKIKIGN